MKFLKTFLLIFFLLESLGSMIFNFNKDTDTSQWQIIDDVVMGGESQGRFTINKNGNGVFSGKVSLENNGGFSSVRFQSEINSKDFSKIVLKIKGDRKNYQFRIKRSARDYQSYKYEFVTSGEWEEIEIKLAGMYPTFRGRKLNMPNFSGNKIEEIRFLIGNKKEQSFKLEIDKIYFQ